MFQIERVEIMGFWGKYSIKTDFFTEVNIFIGKNGTGKTTFMNLLQAVLQIDISMLVSLEFNEITIKLIEGRKRRTIKVEREDNPNVAFEMITFRIGRKAFQLQIFEGEVNFRKMVYRRPKFIEQYESLKLEINSLVKVSSLSVHRTQYTAQDSEEPLRRQNLKSAIDQRLDYLMQRLTSYQLSLELKAGEESSKFEKEVLISMLYDQRFDKWDIEDISNVELNKEKKELSKAFRELKVLDENVSKKIDSHIKVLTAGIKRLRDPERKQILVSDVFPLSLLRRTQHIIDLTKQTEKKKQLIFQPISEYLEIIMSFMGDKSFEFGFNGELKIIKDKKPIDKSQLSSGEKQLLILLTETLLQRNQTFIFLADEPELSLHIEWQSMVISSIKALNRNAQIIVATHSPEIAGGWAENIIDMEDILNG